MTDEDIAALGFISCDGSVPVLDPEAVIEALFVLPPLGPDEPERTETKIRQAKEFRWGWIASGTGGDINGYRLMQAKPAP